jgi:hypothetical protein
MATKEKGEEFDFDKLKHEIVYKLDEIMDKIPSEWKAYAADFIAVHVTINAASNLYEGIGILESAKNMYIECVEAVRDEECDGNCSNCAQGINLN